MANKNSKGESLVTMINNINYNNNNNNTKIVSDENNPVEGTSSLSRGLAPLSASQPLGVAFMPSGTLPAAWKGLKIDLFENPKLKLKLTIVRPDNTKFECVAGMNSKPSQVFRGRDDDKGTEEYWCAVETVLEQRRQENGFRISKVSKPRKGGTIDGLAVALYQQESWMIDLIYDDSIYTFALKGNITEKFAQVNGIATAYYGIANTRPWASKEELGI